MNYWNYEAGNHTIDFELEKQLYFNNNIKKYIKIGDHETGLFLVGPKGLGKTLFINYKSFLYRNTIETSGYDFLPQKQLCENLTINKKTFSKTELLKFRNLEIWEKLWFFSISVAILKSRGQEIPKLIRKGLDDKSQISSIISFLLTNRNLIDKYFEILPELQDKIATIHNGVAIFIDNTDQQFEDFLKEPHYTDYVKDGQQPSIEVWTNSQIGLMTTSYKLNKLNSHIKLFCTLRLEAFNNITNSMKFNYANYATVLRYHKEELRKIFELNIKAMNLTELVSSRFNNSIYNFLGFSKMPHPFAIDEKNDKPQEEEPFDFIYRHTFGRPREIVLLGYILYYELLEKPFYKVLSTRERIAKVRTLTNKLSDDLFENYRKEVIPEFNFIQLKNFLSHVRKNVFNYPKITNKYIETVKGYYNLGLIGYISESLKDNYDYEQNFLPPAEYTYNSIEDLPRSKYFITHPAMDTTFKKLTGLKFYNHLNIIGHGYPFKLGDFTKQIVTGSYEFEVALSFAGERRDYVEEVAEYLQDHGISVFYDDHRKTQLWGKDLFQHLAKIYKDKAKLCVVFICEHYVNKLWTKHELKNIQERSFLQDEDYLLPVRFDETEVPGINSTRAYLDCNSISPSELSSRIIDKLKSTP